MREIIEDDLCSFELSKLLKEKGFSNGTRGCFTEYLKTNKSDNPSFSYKKGEIEFTKDYIINKHDIDLSNETYFQCERPTHNIVIKWLRKNYNTHLEIFKEKPNLYFCFNNNDVAKVLIAEGSSPEEATEKGITEILKLI